MNFLSLDVGTTCCKCQLFSDGGEILAYRSEEYPLCRTADGTYVDIAEIWQRVQRLIAFAAERAPFASVCISTFGESFVPLDENDEPLMLPLLYTDPRGDDEAKEIAEMFDAGTLFARNGTRPDGMFSVSKLLWLKKNRPEIFGRIDKILLVSDYLGYRLTGRRMIDYGLAARTGAFDIAGKAFDTQLLGALGIDATLFSRPEPSGTAVGNIRPEVCRMLGIRGDCLLVLGSHDQICAALGAGVLHPGEAADGLGTVECITSVFADRPTDERMGRAGYVCVPYAVPGLYCTYMFNYAGGALINWYKNSIVHGYRGDADDFFAYMERGVRGVPSGILTLPYFAGAATPYGDIRAKGAVLNLTTATTDAQLYQSLLEATAMEMRLNAETAETFGIAVRSAVATGGGANSAVWLQLKADIQNLRIRTLRSAEGGLCGCAMLQAVATGAAADLTSAADTFVRYKDEYTPDAARHAAYQAQYEKYKKLYPIVKEFY